MGSGRRIAPLLAAALLAACGAARKVENAVTTGGGICVACHGGVDNTSGAPPNDLLGRTDTSLVSVGAHTAHGVAGLDCGACHVKPATVVAPGHGDGQVQITWGPLATANGAVTPTFDEASATCTNVYCHGAFPGGNRANAPRWTRVGAGETACGTCHGVPPPQAAGHVQRSGCGDCHAGYTATSVNPATHLDGTVEVGALSCTSCHGDAARAATTTNPQLSAAPPVDAAGLPSSAQVGAHQAHLTDGALRPAMACTECHVVPTSVAGDHPTGTTTFAWDPLLAATRGARPSYTGGACASTYCHGATLGAGGTNHAPRWTGGAAEVECGTCHGVPPPAPHPQNPRCGQCHPGYDAGGVNLALHVNGARDLLPMTCTSCHGDAGRAATATNPQLPAAPPFDVAGVQSSAQVGAHQAHLTDGALRPALACTECHPVPSSPVNLAVHPDPTGATTFVWGPLATGNGAVTPAFDEASATCANVYCHGAFPGGKRENTPRWNGGAAEVAGCKTCHGSPPPAPHPNNTSCGRCHPGYDAGVNLALHVNGVRDLVPMTCTSCHGDAGRLPTTLNPQLPAAPPADAAGLQSSPAVGAHQRHLSGSALAAAVACTECHPVPSAPVNLAVHPDPTGVTTFVWGPLATGALSAIVNPRPPGSGVRVFSGFSTTTPRFAADGACSSTYCHGSYSGSYTYPAPQSDPLELKTVTYAGLAAAPSWSRTAACGSCHGIPPATGTRWHDGAHGGGNDCGLCHPDATGTSAANASVTDPAKHVDGKIDLDPKFQSSCFGCH